MFEYIELFFLGYFAALTPGPDSLFVLKNSFVSLKNAFLSVLGILLGNIIYLSLVYFGFSNLGKNPYFLGLVSLFGGFYLLYLAYLSFKEKTYIKLDINEKKIENEEKVFLKALLTNLSNPKALLFFSSILTPFLTKNILLSLLFLYIGIALAFFSIAIFGSKIPLNKDEKILSIANKIIAILFLIFSYKLFSQFIYTIL